jgi:hypothetical protein
VVLRGDSSPVWGGGLSAHAEIGNKIVARDYLQRALALQPTWLDMARTYPLFAPFLLVSTHAADALRRALGMFSTRTYQHAHAAAFSLEVARFTDVPGPRLWTYATIGLANTQWPERGRPRVELMMGTSVDAEACGSILANLAFHLADTGFFPEPGMMVRDVIGALGADDLSARLPHVYVAMPRAWRLSLPIAAGPPPITLAQAVAVSEAEYALWRDDPAGFEWALADRHVDLMDLARRG